MHTQHPRMYVLVRSDLSETYRSVQGSHALSQYALEHPEMFKVWNNSTLVFLGVRNLLEIKMWEMSLIQKGKMISAYREPDQDGQITAIACFDLGDIFRSLKTAG